MNAGDGTAVSSLNGSSSIVNPSSNNEASSTSIVAQTSSLQGWEGFAEATEIRVQTGYAEYIILNKAGEKIYTALLTYDERSCLFSCLCSSCCKADSGYIPHNKLYPNAPDVSYPRNPLNISGFGVQVYDTNNQDVYKFHRSPHDTKDLSKDENMIVSLPSRAGGLMGKVSLPRSKCGDFYEIYNSMGKLIYEIPTRIKSGMSGYLFDVVRRKDMASLDEFTVVAMIVIEGKNQLDLSFTSISHIPAGDFIVQFLEELHTSEKALILAAAFYIRIREFSSYIPMVEALAAASVMVVKEKSTPAPV